MRYKCLDLFCCAGGAAMGLHRAGFDVTGVDINPQPRYPFEFIQGDALAQDLSQYDFVWASPPCQAHSSLTSLTSKRNNADLIPATRAKTKQWGGIYIIENVAARVLENPVRLCGTHFGLHVARHRYFESNVPLVGLGGCDHRGKELYTVLTKSCRKIGDMRGPSSHEKGKAAMGIDWMTQHELGEAIPPAYSEYLGRQVIQHIESAREARCEELVAMLRDGDMAWEVAGCNSVQGGIRDARFEAILDYRARLLAKIDERRDTQ